MHTRACKSFFECLPHYALSDVIKIMLEIAHLCMTYIFSNIIHILPFDQWSTSFQFRQWCVWLDTILEDGTVTLSDQAKALSLLSTRAVHMQKFHHQLIGHK